MRSAVFLLLIAIFSGCASSKKTANGLQTLNGTWTVISQEMAGKALPEAAFQKEKMVLSDSTYTFYAESIDRGVIRVNGDKMDIYGREGVNAGKHFTALYKFESDTLVICYNLMGDGYPESFETTSAPLLFISVFKKQ